ncbi:MAG: F0F1 ATP synthase subunit A [Pseudomonadota bacterium]
MNHPGLSPFPPVVFALGPVQVTLTVIYTWVEMAALVGVAAVFTRALGPRPGGGQNLLEMVVEWLLDTIGAVAGPRPERLLTLVGTLALFIAVGDCMSVVPGLMAPTRDLGTTAALSLVVFCAVPYYGVRDRGLTGYLRHYLEPAWVMLPFNLLAEVSRTVAMAVRLFGNMMSEELIIAVLLTLAGLLVPVPIMALSLLTGLVQAYIFSVLTLVYIGAVLGGRGGG